MKTIEEYLEFERKGRPVSDINPGSNEVAFEVPDAFSAIWP